MFKIQFSDIQKLFKFSKNVAKFVVEYTLPKKEFYKFLLSKKKFQKKQHWGGKKKGRTTKLLSSVEC